MTKLLEQAIQRALALPPETQDDLARIILRLADSDEPVYRLSDEETADLDEAEAEIARGELATDEAADEVFGRHRH